jgi:hypothetical protein
MPEVFWPSDQHHLPDVSAGVPHFSSAKKPAEPLRIAEPAELASVSLDTQLSEGTKEGRA